MLVACVTLSASLLAFTSQASAAPAPSLVNAVISATSHIDKTATGLVLTVDGTISAPDVVLVGQTLVLSVNHVVLGVVTIGADGVFHLTKAVTHAVAATLYTAGATLEFAGVTVHRTLNGLDWLLGALGLIPVEVHVQPITATVAVLLDAGVIL